MFAISSEISSTKLLSSLAEYTDSSPGFILLIASSIAVFTLPNVMFGLNTFCTKNISSIAVLSNASSAPVNLLGPETLSDFTLLISANLCISSACFFVRPFDKSTTA